MNLKDFLGYTWINNQLDEINRKLDMILVKMEGGRNVSPDLEAVVRNAAALVKRVDEKVPDQPRNL